MRKLLQALPVAALLVASSATPADNPRALQPKGDPLFDDHDPEAKSDTNVSGVTCFDDSHCILVADEMIAIQQIRLALNQSPSTYNAGRTYGLLFGDRCTDLRKRKHCKEVDLEAVGRRDRQIFVTGSMGNRSRTGKRAKDRWFLARFEITKTGKPKSGSLVLQSSRPVLKQLYGRHDELAPYLELPLQCGGVNVEGLAVIADQFYLGLRSPADLNQGSTYVVQVSDTVLTARRKSDVPETILHRLTFRHDDGKPIKGIGIRALEPLGDKLLVATGDAGVSAPSGKSRRRDMQARCADVPGGRNLRFIEGREPLLPRIWIWDPAKKGDPVEIARLEGRYADEKLEGIAVLGTPSKNTTRIDLLLTIDGQNDVPALAVLNGVKIPN